MGIRAAFTLVLSVFHVVIATTSNATHIEKRSSQNGIIIPVKLVGRDIFVKFKAGLFTGTNPGYAKTLWMKVTPRCDTSEYHQYSAEDQPETYDVGLRAKSVNSEYIYFQGVLPVHIKQRRKGDGVLCVKSIANQQDPFSNLLSKFDRKVFSLSIQSPPAPFPIATDSQRLNAELGFGLTPDSDYIHHSRFHLKPLSDPDQLPWAWETRNPVQLSLNGNPMQQGSCNVVFDINHTFTFLPSTVYEQIIQPLRQSLSSALSSSGLPSDVSRLISDFAEEPIVRFDCNDANRIPNLQFGDLAIPKSKVYGRTGNSCALTIYPFDTAFPECRFLIGLAFIKGFEFSIDYAAPDGEYAQFSTRGSPVQQNTESFASSSSGGVQPTEQFERQKTKRPKSS